MAVKRISIQDLKARLSAAVAEAEAGDTLLVTRHNEAVAVLGPARLPHTHRGSQVGQHRLRPVLRKATKGRYLAVLLEDRDGR